MTHNEIARLEQQALIAKQRAAKAEADHAIAKSEAELFRLADPPAPPPVILPGPAASIPWGVLLVLSLVAASIGYGAAQRATQLESGHGYDSASILGQ